MGRHINRSVVRQANAKSASGLSGRAVSGGRVGP